MTEGQQRGESRLRERLEKETDVRMTLLSWLHSEILVIRSQIERINSQNNCQPSAIAAERLKEQVQTCPFKHPYGCWICGNEVDLETCNIDEHGMAVHEDCYFVKVALATESMRLMMQKPAN